VSSSGSGTGPEPKLGFATRSVHGVLAARSTASAVAQRPASVPIYQTSTWRFSTGDELAGVLAGTAPGYAYGRGYGNPTVEVFESTLALLERTEAAFAFSSGMSAIHAVAVSLARAGDRVVTSRELYGGTYSLFRSVLPRYGIEVDEVDPHDLEAVRRALPGAAFFYCETIANPLCTVADLSGLAAACHEAGVPAVVDNTFASPYLCNPAELGFAYVIHSVTKMIAGHSDLVGGAVCSSEQGRALVRRTALDTGGAMPPFEAWLCLRGMETLELRMQRMSENATALATMLEGRDEVAAVHYPGLRSHRHYERARALLGRGLYGSMLSFELSGGAAAATRWCEALEIAGIAVSLGGTHTLVCHPASTTHRQVHPEARRAAGIGDGLVRVSAGIENVEDLLADFERAFWQL
jgi:cystathionine beta-lyase/cystathionine gamma-synthase